MTVVVGRFSINQDVSQELVDDLLCTAFEGGSMWIDYIRTPVFPEGADYGHEVISRDGYATIAADGEHFNLTLPAFIRGIKLHCENKPTSVVALEEDHDADDADCILQYALFGEVVYG